MKTSSATRALYDCASVPLTPAGPNVRLVIATHAGTSSSPAVGTERDGMVYELFVSTLPSPAFTASDVLDLYLHRGSFETVLADEDEEQDMDRWYSHTPCGKAVRPNPRAMDLERTERELGQQLAPAELRTTEFAPAREVEISSTDEPDPAEAPPPAIVYGPPQWAQVSFTHGAPFSAFTPQPDGTLRCLANHPLYPQERRPERDGSLRILYAARIGHCRSWPDAGHSVKRAVPRSSHDGSVRSCGRFPLLTQIPRRLPLQPAPSFLLLRFSGATGHVVASGALG